MNEFAFANWITSIDLEDVEDDVVAADDDDQEATDRGGGTMGRRAFPKWRDQHQSLVASSSVQLQTGTGHEAEPNQWRDTVDLERKKD